MMDGYDYRRRTSQDKPQSSFLTVDQWEYERRDSSHNSYEGDHYDTYSKDYSLCSSFEQFDQIRSSRPPHHYDLPEPPRMHLRTRSNSATPVPSDGIPHRSSPVARRRRGSVGSSREPSSRLYPSNLQSRPSTLTHRDAKYLPAPERWGPLGEQQRKELMGRSQTVLPHRGRSRSAEHSSRSGSTVRTSRGATRSPSCTSRSCSRERRDRSRSGGRKPAMKLSDIPTTGGGHGHSRNRASRSTSTAAPAPQPSGQITKRLGSRLQALLLAEATERSALEWSAEAFADFITGMVAQRVIHGPAARARSVVPPPPLPSPNKRLEQLSRTRNELLQEVGMLKRRCGNMVSAMCTHEDIIEGRHLRFSTVPTP